MKQGLSALLLCCAMTTMVPAVSAQELDEVLQGFDDNTSDDALQSFDDSPAVLVESSETTSVSPWQWKTLILLSSSYNTAHDAPADGQTDHRGLSRLRLKLQPELRYQINPQWRALAGASLFYDFVYDLRSDSSYSDEVIESYRQETELRELYVQGRIGNLDVTLGRQIVVWGKSDSLRVVDVLNPLDNREPGMVDIEDLRLPLAMSRFDYYHAQWRLTALAIHEIRFDKSPPLGSDFYPSPVALPDEIVPDARSDTEYGLALAGRFSGWDLSFHWADYYDDQAHLVMNQGSPQRQHSRLNMGGMAFNLASGAWLWKTELAWIDGLQFSTGADQTWSRVDLMVGADYNGWTDSVVSLEIANRHLLDYESKLAQGADGSDQDVPQTALRLQRDLLHQTLHLTALALLIGKPDDSLQVLRVSLGYDLRDALTLTAGAIDYRAPADSPRAAAADNDRMFMELRYTW